MKNGARNTQPADYNDARTVDVFENEHNIDNKLLIIIACWIIPISAFECYAIIQCTTAVAEDLGHTATAKNTAD